MEAAVGAGYAGESPFNLKPAADLFAGEGNEARSPAAPAAKRKP
jgi:hypothetical protein